MRIALVYLALLAVLAVSIGAGLLASDWPRRCIAWHWCGPDFMARGAAVPARMPP